MTKGVRQVLTSGNLKEAVVEVEAILVVKQVSTEIREYCNHSRHPELAWRHATRPAPFPHLPLPGDILPGFIILHIS